MNAVHFVPSAVELRVVIVDCGHRCPLLSSSTVIETGWWLLLHFGVVLGTCASRLWVAICLPATMNVVRHSEATDVGHACC
mgnify:FL=1